MIVYANENAALKPFQDVEKLLTKVDSSRGG